MGFGNFLKGIAAQVNPFDNGKTYGSYNRKRREEDENQQPQLTTPRQSSMPTPRQTDNAFQNKTIGGQSFNFNLTPQNQVNVPRKSEYDYSLDVPKPKQSFGNRIRDIFDANTEADQYRRLTRDASNIRKDLIDRGVDPSKAFPRSSWPFERRSRSGYIC